MTTDDVYAFFLAQPIAPFVALLTLLAPSNWWTDKQKKQNNEQKAKSDV